MAETEFIDYYELLGVATDAEPKQIRAAFMRLAKQHHPDVGGQTVDMQLYNTAYRTLMSASSRKSYDMMYDFKTGRQIARYHAADNRPGGSNLDDMSDEEIDDFLDDIYAEYRAQPKPKTTLKDRLRRII